jgi:hypothetical protein
LNPAAEIVESADEPQYGLAAVTTGETFGAQIAVWEAVFQHVVSGGEHRSGNGEDGFFGPST